MNHAVILAHPDPESFNASVARTYADAARSLGHRVIVRDLYRSGFDPCLPIDELPWREDYRYSADLVRERAAVGDAQVFVFVYPLWFNAPPAILKGWVDRVFGMGFGYHPARGGNAPGLKGRRLLSFSSSGAPDQWLDRTGAMVHLRRGFDDHLAGMCGLTVADHVHFGGVTPGIRDDAVEDMLAKVARTVTGLFASEAA